MCYYKHKETPVRQFDASALKASERWLKDRAAENEIFPGQAETKGINCKLAFPFISGKWNASLTNILSGI